MPKKPTEPQVNILVPKWLRTWFDESFTQLSGQIKVMTGLHLKMATLGQVCLYRFLELTPDEQAAEVMRVEEAMRQKAGQIIAEHVRARQVEAEAEVRAAEELDRALQDKRRRGSKGA
jgi:hypothetical protein